MVGRLGRLGLLIATIVVGFALAAPADAAPSWLAPEDQPQIDGSEPPNLAVDDFGNVYVVWLDTAEGDVVKASVRAAGGSWSPPEVISSGPDSSPPVVAAAGGTAVAAWVRTDPGGLRTVETARLLPNGLWVGPIAIYEPASGAAVDPRIAIDSAGNAAAVWVRSTGGDDRIEAAYQQAGGAWTEPIFLSEAGVDAEGPQVTIDGAGVASVIWEHGSGFDRQIKVRRFAGGKWGLPVILSEDGRAPDIAADSEGNLTAVWEEFDGFDSRVSAAHRSSTTGEWLLAGYISAAGIEAFEPKVAAAKGAAVAAWSGDIHAEAAAKPAGGDWLPSVTLSPDGATQTVDVAIDVEGTATVVWDDLPDDGGWRIMAARRPVAGPWQPGQVISPPVDEADDFDLPRVAARSAGDAFALWLYEPDGASEYTVQTAAFDGTGPELRALSIPETGRPGQELSFSVTPFDVFSAVGPATWSFGDGTTAVGNAVTHSFAKPGEYEVTVTVTDELGNATLAASTVRIVAAPPVVKRNRARAGRVAPVRRGAAVLALRCPKGAPCRGLARLTVAVKRKAKVRQVSIGARRIALAAGRSGNVRVALNRRGLQLLRRATKPGRPLQARLSGDGVQPRRVVLRSA